MDLPTRRTPSVTPLYGRRSGPRTTATLGMVACAIVLTSLTACGPRQPSASRSVMVTPTTDTTPMANPTATPFGAPPSLLGGWTWYRDPRGAFTVQVPQGWSALVEVGVESSSFNGPEPDYAIALGQPPGGQVTINFSIRYLPLVGTGGHADGCASMSGAQGSLNATTVTLAGLPATYVALRRTEQWYLTTATDSFVLSWWWPGYTGDWPGLNAGATYPDPATWHADQELAHLILSTFRPADTTPISCP